MNERDTERRLRDWLDAQAPSVVPDGLRRAVAAIPTTVPAGWPDRLAAALGPRRAAAPRFAWILLLLAALLAAVVGGAILVGSQPQQRLPAVVPPIGPVATCPPGSTPDEPGPVDQARPPIGSLERIVFDRRAGRLVAVTPNLVSAEGLGPQTWTFDVCTNTWTQMHPARELPDFVFGQLVYDVDSDVTIGVFVSGRVWAYDLQANTWTEKGVVPEAAPQVTLGAYDPVSGLVVDDLGMWTYDVETDAWTQIRQANGPPCEYGASAYDASVDRLVTYSGPGWGDDTTMLCLVDIRTSTWSATNAATVPVLNTGFYASDVSSVYDEATDRTVFSDETRWAAYDATADRWEILVEAVPGSAGIYEAVPGAEEWAGRVLPLLIAYDPLNRRIVGIGWHRYAPDVVAFDPVTREWTILLD